MQKLYLFTALTLTLIGCDTIIKKRLPGTYQYTGQNASIQALRKFELTDSKLIGNFFMGRQRQIMT
jgi:uncharacterized protein YceK